MKRLALIVAGVAVAGGVAATPAVAGLAGNPSFSHEIPVPAPSAAKAPLFADDHGGLTPHAEPGDDHGGITPHAEPGDDHGGITPHAEPGDDRGGATPATERPDDSSGHHGGRR
jgi:hypothetical protein